MKKRVALIFGGRSLESDISVITALQALAALKESDYEVQPFYLCDGDFYMRGVDDISAFTPFEKSAHLKTVLKAVGKDYEDEAVAAIARAGAGSMRDSLSVADMCISYSTGKLTYADVNEVLGSADFYEKDNMFVCCVMLYRDF